MSKKFKSAVEGFQSKNRDRKKRGATISFSNARSYNHTKRKRRKNIYKASSSTHSKKQTISDNQKMTPNEALLGIILLLFIGVFGLLLINTLINNGIKAFLLFLIALIVLVAVVIIGLSWYKVNREEAAQKAAIDEYQIPYLQGLLIKIENYQDVINNSDNVEEVKLNLDLLIGVMDEIMTYDENILRQAGMTKETMPAQKQFILDNYSTVLDQVKERKQSNS